ncbi:hypothetical protein F5Y05DRAFT_126204 [Hypoxylon sp. FL0543]|nr:hypothetical protein F5Y05DRAFT_126204 [Hypoxylon sp. FL0543]
MNEILNHPSCGATSDHIATALDERHLASAGEEAQLSQQAQPAPQEDTAGPHRANTRPAITFAELPPEVREMIWQRALPGPRVFIALVFASAGLKMQLLERGSLRMPLAHVCFESRQIVRKAGYVLAFRDEDQPDDPGVWFNPYHDIVERTLWSPGDFLGLGVVGA